MKNNVEGPHFRNSLWLSPHNVQDLSQMPESVTSFATCGICHPIVCEGGSSVVWGGNKTFLSKQEGRG